MKQNSLKKKLITWISVPVLATILLTLFFAYKTIRHEINEVYDANLINATRVLFALSKQELQTIETLSLGVENHRFRHRYRNKIEFIIWKDNQLALSSLPMRMISRHNPKTQVGFSNQRIGRTFFRSFTFMNLKEDIRIQVIERVNDRNELIIELLATLILPVIFLILLIALMIYFGIHFALKPIINLSNDVDQRNSGDLSAINKEKLPKEILPLISAINRLFKRITKSLNAEREFTNHAAHELRTPLAAMKTQTQVLIRKNKLKKENVEDLENLELSINRATHLIEQLLLLARLENQSFMHQSINLSELLRQCINQLKASIEEKNISLKQKIIESLTINGNPDTISILLNNLLINSIKYTDNNGAIFVSLNQNGQFIIKDTGVGIQNKDKKAVFKRFVRKDKTGQLGSGLGLSIAQSIAQSHQTKIKLKDNRPKGLIVLINWQVF